MTDYENDRDFDQILYVLMHLISTCFAILKELLELMAEVENVSVVNLVVKLKVVSYNDDNVDDMDYDEPP